MDNCTFCKLVRGELPALVIYEEENVIALLPKEMEVPYHTLVIPKEHFADLYNIPENIFADITRVCKQLTLDYRERIGATGMNLLHASGKDGQQSVPHFHIHLFPRFENDGIDAWPKLPEVQIDRNETLKKLKNPNSF